jgi:hypothetical protein
MDDFKTKLRENLAVHVPLPLRKFRCHLFLRQQVRARAGDASDAAFGVVMPVGSGAAVGTPLFEGVEVMGAISPD